jgi:membrane protein YqaA with SNARE-associated domain
MFTRLKHGLLEAARGPHALRALASVSFIESSIFPVPPDVMLVPMVLAHRERAFMIATVCTLASVAGGLAGYAIGYYGWELVGRPLLALLYGDAEIRTRLAQLRNMVEDSGLAAQFMAVSFAGLTPFPYKIMTIASGTLQVGLPVFVAASLFSRGLRFYAEAALLYVAGRRAEAFVEKRFGAILTVFFLLLIGGFVAFKFLLPHLH